MVMEGNGNNVSEPGTSNAGSNGESLDADLEAFEQNQLEREATNIENAAAEDLDGPQKPVKDKPLSVSILRGTKKSKRFKLSCLENVGLGFSCAYVKLDLQRCELTNIDMLNNFIHLRYVDISENYLTDISPISVMTNLCNLNASRNRLAFLQLDELPYLQKANFSFNKIISLEGTCHPVLEELYLEDNNVQKINFPDVTKLANLRILDLKDNKISSVEGEYPENLQDMSLAFNLISSLEGLPTMKTLRNLNIRGNQIRLLTPITPEKLPSITHINLRGNSIEETEAIKPLKDVSTLVDLVLEGNPIEREIEYRSEVLAALDLAENLKKLDSEKVTDSDIKHAIHILRNINEAQKARTTMSTPEVDDSNNSSCTLISNDNRSNNKQLKFGLELTLRRGVIS